MSLDSTFITFLVPDWATGSSCVIAIKAPKSASGVFYRLQATQLISSHLINNYHINEADNYVKERRWKFVKSMKMLIRCWFNKLTKKALLRRRLPVLCVSLSFIVFSQIANQSAIHLNIFTGPFNDMKWGVRNFVLNGWI